MKTPSGILHVVDFKTDQIVAAIQPEDYWDDKRHWELKNNVDMLDFTAFDGTDHAVTLQQQNLVLKEVRDGRIVPYVITETEKNSDTRSITTYASGAWIQIAKSGIIKPQRIESKTVNEFIDLALLGMKWQRGITEYAGFHTMTIDEFIDPLTFLKKIASLFDLEIQYRVEVVGSQITGWYVDMIKRRGHDTGKEIELGKDLVGVTRMEHTRNICSALVGFVKGEGDKVITIESMNKGLPYIVDADAFQRWNEQGKHKFGFYTPETEEQNMTPERLMTLMKMELKKRVNTSVSYEVEARLIGRVFGLAHELIHEGDTIRIKDTGFTPKLYLEARVIAGDESFTDPSQDKYVFGDYREIVDANEEMQKLYNKIRNSLWDKASNEALKLLEKQLENTDEYIHLNAQAVNQKLEKLIADLKVTVQQISAKVGKGDIASELNMNPQSVLIKSELIDLVGKVKAEWLIAGLLQGMTIKTSNEKEHIHMQNQVLKFVNQGVPKMIMGFENEYNSTTLNPYIILGQGDGTGRNVGTIYKDGNGVYYRFIDNNGLESNMRLTAQGNVGMTAQTGMWLHSNGSFVLDGKHAVTINHAGKNVAEFSQGNGVNFDVLLGENHRIRSSTASGHDKLLQIRNSDGGQWRGLEVSEITAHGGIRSDTNLWAEQNSYAMQHINRSTEKIKTAIHELPFSPLEKVKGLRVKEYFLKRDMYELYQMRMSKPADRLAPYTTNDIEKQYGLIAEETDEIFTTKEKDGIKLYTTLSILTAAVQELEAKHDGEMKVLEEKHKVDMERMNDRLEVLEQLLLQK